MSRYEQRKRKFLQDPEVAEGYQEMEAEIQVRAAESVKAPTDGSPCNLPVIGGAGHVGVGTLQYGSNREKP